MSATDKKAVAKMSAFMTTFATAFHLKTSMRFIKAH